MQLDFDLKAWDLGLWGGQLRHWRGISSSLSGAKWRSFGVSLGVSFRICKLRFPYWIINLII